MTEEHQLDLGRRAANYVFSSLATGYEVLEIFVELIREADLDAFRARLLENYTRDEQDFEARYPGEKERSRAEFEARHPGEWARRLREAGQ
jgi:hypothetical protein